MFPWEREPKIKVCFSYSLPLKTLLSPIPWPQYVSDGSREAAVGAVMKCWQSKCPINLPFPRYEGCLTLGMPWETWDRTSNMSTWLLRGSRLSWVLPPPTPPGLLTALRAHLFCILTLLMAPGPSSKLNPFPVHTNIHDKQSAPVQNHLLSPCSSLWRRDGEHQGQILASFWKHSSFLQELMFHERLMGLGEEKIKVYFPQLELNLGEIRFYKERRNHRWHSR